MMNRKRLLVFACMAGVVLVAAAQTFTEQKVRHELSVDNNRYVVTGFVPFAGLDDRMIYANALLWAVENICPQQRDGLTAVDMKEKTFGFDVALTSPEDAKQKNTYYCKVMLRVTDGKLTYYVSNVLVESLAVVVKKVTALERLQPEKRAAHKETMDDFVTLESQMLNRLFDYVASNKPTPITHWDEITISKPVKGMTEDECRLAFGKPQTVSESNGEVQWMYTSSFYLFFKGGKVTTIIK